MVRVYVAGASNDREMLRGVMDDLEKGGIEITHDWTGCEAREMTIAEAAECARKDIKGVVNARVVLAFLTRNEYAYRGTRHEIGAALAMKAKGHPIDAWVVNNAGDPHELGRDALPTCMQCCFEYAADRFFTSRDEAVRELIAFHNQCSPKPLGIWCLRDVLDATC